MVEEVYCSVFLEEFRTDRTCANVVRNCCANHWGQLVSRCWAGGFGWKAYTGSNDGRRDVMKTAFDGMYVFE